MRGAAHSVGAATFAAMMATGIGSRIFGLGRAVAPTDEAPERVTYKQRMQTSSRAAEPYYGIKSKGRQGAAGRARQMAAKFAATPIGIRNARGRATSNKYLRKRA